MAPLVSADGLNLSPEAVVACVLVGVLVGLAGMLIRRFLMASADEAVPLAGWLGWRLVRALLRQAPGDRPTEPWFCARCRSRNVPSAGRCYSCAASRVDAEAVVPNAEAPAGPSAGLTQRTRRRG